MNSLNEVLHEQNFKPNLVNKKSHYRVILSGRRTIKLFSNWIYKDKEIFYKENMMCSKKNNWT